MNHESVETWIQTFMNPTVFTGVEPLFIVAEEIQTMIHTGSVVDAVWAQLDDENNVLTYINKFGVQGKILDSSYYTNEEIAPYKGRLALPLRENFEQLHAFKVIQEEIKAVKIEHHALSEVIQKDFNQLDVLLKRGDEVCCFKAADGDWSDPFYRIDIETPYEIVLSKSRNSQAGVYDLKHPSGSIKTYDIKDAFYAFIVGSKAEITGYQLKNTRFKQKLEQLQEAACHAMAQVAWLSLSDTSVKSIMQTLPKHPYDNYFNYVPKGHERKVNPPQYLMNALELMIEKHMPALKTPMGIAYIPLDNLLYLFHDIIPRVEALEVLKLCDIIYEAPAIILGVQGKHKLAPKFLVSLAQVADIYQQFPSFCEACQRYLDEV